MRFTAETRGCLKCKISSLLTRNGGRTYGRTLYGRFSQNQNFWDAWNTMGAIHSTKIQTGPTEKRGLGPPQKVDPFFRNFSGWTEPIHWVLDRNFRKVWLNGSRPISYPSCSVSALRVRESSAITSRKEFWVIFPSHIPFQSRRLAPGLGLYFT